MAIASGLVGEFLFAFGAGDGDFAFALGDTDGLLAFGAGEIAVVSVLNALQKLQIFPIFPIALIGIPGEAAVHCQDQKAVGQHGDDQSGNVVPHKQAHEAKGKANADEQCI